MELIWCFIFVLLGERRGRGGLGPGSEQPPAQPSALLSPRPLRGRWGHAPASLVLPLHRLLLLPMVQSQRGSAMAAATPSQPPDVAPRQAGTGRGLGRVRTRPKGLSALGSQQGV